MMLSILWLHSSVGRHRQGQNTLSGAGNGSYEDAARSMECTSIDAGT